MINNNSKQRKKVRHIALIAACVCAIAAIQNLAVGQSDSSQVRRSFDQLESKKPDRITTIEDKDFQSANESTDKRTATERLGRDPHHESSAKGILTNDLPIEKKHEPPKLLTPPVEIAKTARFNEAKLDNASKKAEISTELSTGSESLEPPKDSSNNAVWNYKHLTDRENLPSTIQMVISFASISLVPAILLMTTCFIRIVVVLGILRQAIGLQQLPPTQVTTALALLMTFLIMTPTWKQVKENAIDPYSAEGSEMTWEEAWREGVTPVKKFMWRQIKAAENDDDFWLFYDYLPEEEKTSEPESFDEIPLKVMMPAFMISELKVAFLIGAQIFLPFLILDIIVASFSNTMGLIMLPPTVVSLPLKLILFVMVDGWNLVVGLLLNSFAPIT